MLELLKKFLAANFRDHLLAPFQNAAPLTRAFNLQKFSAAPTCRRAEPNLGRQHWTVECL
jgi:hypothetical protein